MMFFKKKTEKRIPKTLIEIKPMIENGVRWYKVMWVDLDGNFYIDSGVIDYFYKISEAEDLARHCVENGVPQMSFTVEIKSC